MLLLNISMFTFSWVQDGILQDFVLVSRYTFAT